MIFSLFFAGCAAFSVLLFYPGAHPAAEPGLRKADVNAIANALL